MICVYKCCEYDMFCITENGFNSYLMSEKRKDEIKTRRKEIDLRIKKSLAFCWGWSHRSESYVSHQYYIMLC